MKGVVEGSCEVEMESPFTSAGLSTEKWHSTDFLDLKLAVAMDRENAAIIFREKSTTALVWSSGIVEAGLLDVPLYAK